METSCSRNGLAFHPAYRRIIQDEAAWFVGEKEAHVFEGAEAVALAKHLDEPMSFAALLAELGRAVSAEKVAMVLGTMVERGVVVFRQEDDHA